MNINKDFVGEENSPGKNNRQYRVLWDAQDINKRGGKKKLVQDNQADPMSKPNETKKSVSR